MESKFSDRVNLVNANNPLNMNCFVEKAPNLSKAEYFRNCLSWIFRLPDLTNVGQANVTPFLNPTPVI